MVPTDDQVTAGLGLNDYHLLFHLPVDIDSGCIEKAKKKKVVVVVVIVVVEAMMMNVHRSMKYFPALLLLPHAPSLYHCYP